MARVVVIGGGFAGMASAARLAKLGHDVTVLEASDQLGGALGRIELDGFSWDAGPSGTLLPAVIRDLFRKSGRPAERELDLVPLTAGRRHRFADGTELDLPAGSRAAQLEAVGAALGTAAGGAWVDYVEDRGGDWETLRREMFERPWSPEHASAEATALLRRRTSLEREARRRLHDDRLRELALHLAVMEGHNPRNVPAWFGMWSYVEQNFGQWTIPGGMGALSGVLAERLALRGAQVRTGVEALDLIVRGGRIAAVAAAVEGEPAEFDADWVVVAIDPRRLPALAPLVERTMPTIPPVICHLGLRGELPDLPGELVLHGDPLLVVRTGGTAPEGCAAWTVLGRGRLAEDIVTALHRAGIKVRDQIEARVDRSPVELVRDWRGSPLGVLWQGRRTLDRMLGTSTPIAGVVAAGAHTRLGAGLPSAGLSAALAAQAIGPA